MDDYELLDVGGGARLERFGDHVTDRPHGGILAERRDPGRWAEADLRFDRDGGWTGPGLATATGGWPIRIGDIALELRPTDAGQVGVFPEHAYRLPWLTDRVTERRAAGREVDVLNLFAYTGLATLAVAQAGGRVTHVDAARPSVAWARRNAALNHLDAAPVRWIVDDVRAYVRRELRRGRRYDGIALDPPTYGHGTGGTTSWRFDGDLPDLLTTVGRLLLDDGFVLLTAHTESFGSDRLADALDDATGLGRQAREAEAGDLLLTGASGAILHLGAYAAMDFGGA